MNRTLRGWFEYFKHSWRTTFPTLDGWVRMPPAEHPSQACRTPRPSGHGDDHHRYPNAYFAEQGLFSLTTAMLVKANPLAGKTINRRAGCGRTASPVRREGRPKPIGLPYPYTAIHMSQNAQDAEADYRVRQ